MLILSFDTTSEYCSVALSSSNKLLAASNLLVKNQQAEKLFEMLSAILSYKSLKYSDINYLAITKGPGSFTGIRAGLAAAQGIVMGTSSIIPIVIDNFTVIYSQMLKHICNYDHYIVAFTALRDQLYLKIFSKGNQELLYGTYKEINQSLSKLKGKIVCAGNSIFYLKNKFNDFIFLPRLKQPHARLLGRCAYKQIINNSYSSSLEPLYIKHPSAVPNVMSNTTLNIASNIKL